MLFYFSAIAWLFGVGVTIGLRPPERKELRVVLALCIFAWPIWLGAILTTDALERRAAKRK